MSSSGFSGALYDKTGAYEVGFYCAGAMIFVSGAMLFALPYISRRKKAREDQEKKGNGVVRA